jgi:superfamily II DNA or RNA helicase
LADDDWEIDHPEPWRITHRTNVHELEALHRRCNRQKGGSTPVEIRRWDLLRKGQREAIEMIEARVGRSGTDTTAIVLPCRYGKSDVIRLTSTRLWASGRACAALALSPGEILRDQLSDTGRWDAAYQRYGVVLKSAPRIATILKPKARYNPNGEAFLSATIQLVQTNLDQVGGFADWVESQVHRTGLPLVVYVDECHSSSSENEWGKIVPALADAGAHVVLLTATPERADGVRIPGFEFDTVDEGEIKIWRSKPHQERPDELVTVEVFEGRRQKVALIPDYAVTFEEAWAETGAEPILCKISRQTFDVQLSLVGLGTEEEAWLSELKPTRVGAVLGRVVRHPVAIEEGCRRLIAALRHRRQLLRDFQAIVYCGNDIERGDDKQENKHPVAIRGELVRQDPALDVVIATSAEDGKATIERFAAGRGDVLIVKQMAGMGLDLPMVKVGLDLSATRTYAALVQRMFRPATPYGDAIACEWITPDDVISAAYFKRIVTDAGGEATATELSLTDSYDKERQDGPLSDEDVLIHGVRTGRFDDCSGRKGEPQRWELVEEMMTLLPKLTSFYTHAEIATAAEALRGSAPQEGVTEENAAPVRDSAVGADALRAEIKTCREQIMRRYMIANKIPEWDYGRIVTDFWKDVKIAAQWPKKTKLESLDDLDALQRVLDEWRKIGEELWPTI